VPPSPDELQPANRFEWERIVRRCLVPAQVKLVAFVLAQYGNQHGSEIRPGVGRLAAVCGISERSAKRHVAALLAYGLIERLANGGGPRQRAATYRLTVPVDLLEQVPLLGPDEGTQAIQVARVPSLISGHPGGPSSPGGAVDNSGTQAIQVARVPAPGSENSGHLEQNSGQPAHELGPQLWPTTKETTQRPPTTSPQVSTSPAPAHAAADQDSPPTSVPAARPDGPAQPEAPPSQAALWPSAAPDPAPVPDVEHHLGPGQLRARIHAVHPANAS
jgi:hypothetical protein